jgi:Protein of unknown function (DUF3800)
MLAMYADESGKRDEHEYVLISGYLGLVAQWEEFCEAWRIRLAKDGLPEFHANQFFNGGGIFAGWETKERKSGRECLIQDLAKIINKYSLQTFSCIVHVPGWERVNEEFYLNESLFTPHVMCGRIIVQYVKDWCAKRNYDSSQVEFVFDQGHEEWGKLYKRLKIDLGVEAVERDRRKIKPLQAADWFAYEEFKEVPQSDTGIRARDFRESFRHLLRIPNEPLIYREKGLRALCQNSVMLIPKRSIGANRAIRVRNDLKRGTRAHKKLKRLTKEFVSLTGKRQARREPEFTSVCSGVTSSK